MDGLEAGLVELGVTFVLILGRLGALVATAPLLSETALPLRVKAFMAVAMAGLVTPTVLAASDEALPAATNLIDLASMLVMEVIVGLAIGLGLMVVLAGVQLTGQIVGQMSGMALAEGSDPIFGDTASVFGQVYYLVTMAVFVAAGGHRLLINGLLDTFVVAPPGSGFETEAMIRGFIGLLSVGFELGVRSSAPLMLALFVSTIVLGLVSRTMPQINTMVVGFGINGLLLLGVMTASLGAVAYAYQGPMSLAIDSLVSSLVPGELPSELIVEGG